MILTATREERTEQALFRGARLALDNPAYLQAVRAFTGAMLDADLAPRDLTSAVLAIESALASAAIISREPGIAAGLEELGFLLESHGVRATLEKRDGAAFEPGDVLLRAEGDRTTLLSLERVGLNLVQRMSGIATAAAHLDSLARARCPSVRVVATRKTPWGLLDKRAAHWGRCGTHRLSLGDAIVIKNNHLALFAGREEDAAPLAIARAWDSRADAAFIEIEVRSDAAALAAARAFRGLQERASEPYPFLLMLDNKTPGEITGILDSLRRDGLHDAALIEASGGIAEANIRAYADCGVDAISVGALTHSVRALDLCQRIL